MATLPQKIRRFFGFNQSIAERLVEALKDLPPILKQGDNGEYSYLRILDIANALRAELLSRGLLIIPNDTHCEQKHFRSDLPGRWYTDFSVKTEFTVTDGRSRETFSAYGSGRDMDGHALAIAQTGALKSWLKRLGLIFGELDDPEIEASAPLTRTAQAAHYPREAERLTQYRERAWAEAIERSGQSREQIETHLSKAFGFDVKSSDIIALPPEKFDLAIRLLNANENLAEALEVTLKAERRKKAGPQAVVKTLDRQAKDEVAGD
jgi:hypothetical protein